MKDKQAELELAQAVLAQDLRVRELRRAANLIKNGLQVDVAVGRVKREKTEDFLPESSWKPEKDTKIQKAASIILRSSLIRIDNIIEDLDDDQSELKAKLMKTRFSVHQLIDNLVGEGQDVDTEEIAQFLREKFLSSINNRDISAFMETWMPNFCMYDDFPPLRLMDGKLVKEHIRRVFKAIAGSRSSITELKVETFGGGALATFKFNYDMTIGKFQFLAASRVSVVMVKLHGKWKILHQHWSQARYEPSMIAKLKQVEEGYTPLGNGITA